MGENFFFGEIFLFKIVWVKFCLGENVLSENTLSEISLSENVWGENFWVDNFFGENLGGKNFLGEIFLTPTLPEEGGGMGGVRVRGKGG